MTDTDDTEPVSADADRMQQQNESAVRRAKRLVAQLKEVERFERTLDGQPAHDQKTNS